MAEQVVSVEKARAPIEPNRLGMLLFILSEVVFFGGLILSFIFYRASVPNVGQASKVLDVTRTLIFSLFLFASSFTVWRADKALEKRSHGGFLLWLGLTVAFGAIFLIGQGLEYLRLLSDNVTIDRNLFGSAFFTLTGFHGFHVFCGLVMLSILLGMGIAGSFRGPSSRAVGAISIYWHFVDVVWVVLLTVIYLWSLIS